MFASSILVTLQDLLLLDLMGERSSVAPGPSLIRLVLHESSDPNSCFSAESRREDVGRVLRCVQHQKCFEAAAAMTRCIDTPLVHDGDARRFSWIENVHGIVRPIL